MTEVGPVSIKGVEQDIPETATLLFVSCPKLLSVLLNFLAQNQPHLCGP